MTLGKNEIFEKSGFGGVAATTTSLEALIFPHWGVGVGRLSFGCSGRGGLVGGATSGEMGIIF